MSKKVVAFLISSKKTNFRCDSKITTEKLKRVSGLILAAPQSRFLDEEIKSIWDYIDVGGKLWVMSAEGGDLQLNNNCNAILEKFGTFTCNGESWKLEDTFQ